MSFLDIGVSPVYLTSQELQEATAFVFAFVSLCLNRMTKLCSYSVKYAMPLTLFLFQQSLKRRGSKDLQKSEKKSQQTPTEVC